MDIFFSFTAMPGLNLGLIVFGGIAFFLIIIIFIVLFWWYFKSARLMHHLDAVSVHSVDGGQGHDVILLKEIGRGRFSTVHHARWREQDVAVKVCGVCVCVCVCARACVHVCVCGRESDCIQLFTNTFLELAVFLCQRVIH